MKALVYEPYFLGVIALTSFLGQGLRKTPELPCLPEVLTCHSRGRPVVTYLSDSVHKYQQCPRTEVWGGKLGGKKPEKPKMNF